MQGLKLNHVSEKGLQCTSTGVTFLMRLDMAGKIKKNFKANLQWIS